MLVLYLFQDPISNGSWPHQAERTDRRMDEHAQTNMPLNFFEVGGIKITDGENRS